MSFCSLCASNVTPQSQCAKCSTGQSRNRSVNFMEQSVVIEHQEGDSWALVIVVNRSAYGRRTVTPMIFTHSDCGDFSACPQLRSWARAGLVCVYTAVPPAQREELLKNAVAEFVRQVSQRSFIRERSKVGIVARARASKTEKPIEFFGLTRSTEPALFWLCERSSTAYQALVSTKINCFPRKGTYRVPLNLRLFFRFSWNWDHM